MSKFMAILSRGLFLNGFFMILAGILVLMIVHCGGEKSLSPKVIDSMRPKSPYKWYLENEPPVAEDSLYFIGVATRGVREEDAKSDAYNTALGEIQRYIGDKVRYAADKARSETGTPLSVEEAGRVVNEATTIISQGVLMKAKPTQTQIIEWHDRTNPTINYIDAYRLVIIPKESITIAADNYWREEIRKQSNQNNQAAQDYLERMRKYFNEGTR